MTRQTMIDSLIVDRLGDFSDFSRQEDNVLWVKDMLLHGRVGYENMTNEELSQEVQAAGIEEEEEDEGG